MSAFQGGVGIVGVNGQMWHFLVFEILNQVDGEETFAHAALGIQNEVNTFFHKS
jgi:hypothetical protein